MAYRLGCVTELAYHSINGLRFSPGDIDAVAETFIRLSQDTEQIHSLGLAGRAKAIRRYNLDRMTESLGQAYSAAIAHTAASALSERRGL